MPFLSSARSDHPLKPGGGKIETCALCPKLCRFACPTAQAAADEGRHPTGILSRALLAEKGSVSLEGEAGEVLYHCTSCYACSVPCELGQVPVELIHTLRTHHQPPRVKTLLEAARARGGNPYPVDFTEEVSPSISGGTVIWPGCHSQATHPQGGERIARLLTRLGMENVTVASSTACCGAFAWFLGDEALAREGAGALATAVAGARTVVYLDPPCAWAGRRVPQPGEKAPQPRALHLSQLLLELETPLGVLLDDALRKRGPGPRVGYHDPCLLARPLGVQDAPRRLLKRATGLEPLEFTRHGDQTECCGAGGGHAQVFPKESDEIAEWMLRDLPEGIELLVTASPECANHLGRAPTRVKVMELGEYVAERVGK